MIPGASISYPYGMSYSSICGGGTGVQTLPLLDSSGSSYGSIYLFKDYQNTLHVTVALTGDSANQYYLNMVRLLTHQTDKQTECLPD